VTIRIGASKLQIDRRRVVRLRLTCPTEQSPPCRGTLTLRTFGKVRFRGKTRQLVLGKASFRTAASGTATVRIKLGSPVMGLLRRSKVARKAVAIVNVRDAAGNRGTVRKRLRLLLPATRRK
jgi:hypothetical protein